MISLHRVTDWLLLFCCCVLLIWSLWECTQSLPPGFLSFKSSRRSYPLFSIPHYLEATGSKKCDLHLVLTPFPGCPFVCSMQPYLCWIDHTQFGAASVLTALSALHICSSLVDNSEFLCYMLCLSQLMLDRATLLCLHSSLSQYL